MGSWLRRSATAATALTMAVAWTGRTADAQQVESIGKQLARIDPDVGASRFNVLLDFERPTDTVFVKPDGGAASASPDRAHTGTSCLELGEDTRSLRVNLASLMAGRVFPGDWGLLGGYFFTDGDVDVTVAYIRGGNVAARQKVTLAKGDWTKVLADVAAVAMLDKPSPIAPSDGLTFTFDRKGAPAKVWLDDVVIVNNTQVLADGGTERLTVKRAGHGYVVGRPGIFSFRLAAGDDPGAVKPVETSPVRAVFTGNDGKTYCFYADGRALSDGRQMLRGRDVYARYQDAQEHPAKIEVDPELGRLDRTTPGDADNDGFNELRAAYQVKASRMGVDVTLEPTWGHPMLRPILEVSGLADGKVAVSVEGDAAEDIRRLPDGRALIVLPVDIQRKTTIEIRVP